MSRLKCLGPELRSEVLESGASAYSSGFSSLPTDTHRLAIPLGIWQRMIIGLYDAQTGQRLKLSDPAQEKDHYVVQTH